MLFATAPKPAGPPGALADTNLSKKGTTPFPLP